MPSECALFELSGDREYTSICCKQSLRPVFRKRLALFNGLFLAETRRNASSSSTPILASQKKKSSRRAAAGRRVSTFTLNDSDARSFARIYYPALPLWVISGHGSLLGMSASTALWAGLWTLPVELLDGERSGSARFKLLTDGDS